MKNKGKTAELMRLEMVIKNEYCKKLEEEFSNGDQPCNPSFNSWSFPDGKLSFSHNPKNII